MNQDLLLGNVGGSIYSGNNDTWAAWVYAFSTTTSGTVITTTNSLSVREFKLKGSELCQLGLI